MTAYEYLSAVGLAAAIRTRAISAREAVTAQFAQIDQVKPTVNAVVTQDRKEALTAAARADEMAT